MKWFVGILGQAACPAALTLYVSCSGGADTNPGTAAAPLKSLRAARDLLRAHGAKGDKAVRILGGLCELPELELDERDSHTTWQSEGAPVLLSGGRELQLPANQTGIIKVDLDALGVTDVGNLRARGYAGGSGCILTQNYEPSALELFYRSEAPSEERQMVLARYPDLTYPVSKENWVQVEAVQDDVISVSDALAARMEAWHNETVWAHGLWKWNWADSHRPVRSFDVQKKSLRVGADDINRDVPLTKGGNFYVYNVRAELDRAGEYYVNATAKTLEFLPPAVATAECSWTLELGRSDTPGIWRTVDVMASADASFQFPDCSAAGPEGGRCQAMGVTAGVRVLRDQLGRAVASGVCCNAVTNSVISAVRGACKPTKGTYHVSTAYSIVNISGADNISFTGLEFRHTRGAAIHVRNSSGVVFRDCVMADTGMMAVNISGGRNCGVEACQVEGTGDAGVVLEGGDRQTLTPSAHFIRNSTLHHNQRWIMNFAPNALLAGVGNVIESSEIYNTPHFAVFMQGNDHSMTSTHIHDAAQQCRDCGSFYMGREWTYRGVVLDSNKFSRISSIWGDDDVQAVYLDDMVSSATVTNNVFDGVKRVLELGGGRNHIFRYNLVNNSGDTPVKFDNRGMGWDAAGCKPGGLPYEFLKYVPYNTSAAWAKYPNLSTILQDAPCEPRHNVISDNVMCHGAQSLINQAPSTISSWHSVAANNTVCESLALV